ncbi:MAG: plasmid stabilization protein [Candidatus Poribacteria bacterium]|nr:plasmid stabilization protein [Candidatus Poribacteria bacterium]
MEKMDLQKQATMLIKQLSTEKLKEVVDYLADLQGKDADNILPISHPQEIPEKGLGTFIHNLFKQIGGVELEIPPREPMREPPRFEK